MTDNRQYLRSGSLLLTLFLILLTIGMTRLLFAAINGQALASGSLAGYFRDSPIERPTPTRRALPPAPVQPMTDPDVIAAYQAKQERPPTATPRTRSEYPTRRPHPTETPSTGVSGHSTPTPVRTRSGAGDIAQSNIAMGTLSTATPSLDYVYSMPVSLNDFWHKDYTWKGVGAQNDYVLEALDVNWWRSWTYQPTSDSDPDLSRQIFAPFNVSPNPYSRKNWADEMASIAREFPGRVWLLYNEMDYPPLCPPGQNSCDMKVESGNMCDNKMVHAVMATRGYEGPIAVAGTPSYNQLHSFNPSRTPVWPIPTPKPPGPLTPTFTPTLTPTPGPTPTPAYFLDFSDPCKDVYPTSVPPSPSYFADTVSRSLTKYDGSTQTTETQNIPELYDAMAEVLAQDYAAFYSTIKAVDPSARVFCCGNYFTHQTDWWWSFLSHLEYDHPDVHLDGVHLHTYPWSPATYYDGPPNPQGTPVPNCGKDAQAGMAIDDIWDNCLQPDLAVYMDFHQSVLETRDKPIWISEYGVLSGSKAESGTKVTAKLMEPLAGWIGRSDHRYTGVAWFVAQGDKETELTKLMMKTPVPVSTPKTPQGTTWGAYSSTAYPPTSTPTTTP